MIDPTRDTGRWTVLGDHHAITVDGPVSRVWDDEFNYLGRLEDLLDA